MRGNFQSFPVLAQARGVLFDEDIWLFMQYFVALYGLIFVQQNAYIILNNRGMAEKIHSVNPGIM